jgi:hypothetical protein
MFDLAAGSVQCGQAQVSPTSRAEADGYTLDAGALGTVTAADGPFLWVSLSPVVGWRSVEASELPPLVSSSIRTTLCTFSCTWVCMLTHTPTRGIPSLSVASLGMRPRGASETCSSWSSQQVAMNVLIP